MKLLHSTICRRSRGSKQISGKPTIGNSTNWIPEGAPNSMANTATMIPQPTIRPMRATLNHPNRLHSMHAMNPSANGIASRPSRTWPSALKITA